MINAFTLVVSTLLLTTSSAASIPLQDAGAPHDVDAHFFASRALPTTNSTANSTSNSTSVCSVDQTLPPTNLTLCGNATLFNVWRSKARITPPEGWSNDPMAMWQRAEKDGGGIHAGWQAHPRHITWGNISMSAATTNDFGVTWTDLNKTLWPYEIYDIRGVFDGTIIKDGYNGHPSILYTSTYTTALGATANEIEGSETQSIAWTEDGGKSWSKLPYGAGGNPVIYEWPMQNLTGFRDPYVFPSPTLATLLASNSSSSNSTTPKSDIFTTISGGVVGEGSKLFLYRQNNATSNVTDWDYVGPFLETGLNQSWSEWSGNYGINFETASANRLNATGDATYDTSDSAVDFLSFGTEGARDLVHQKHWALWAAVNHSLTDNGTVNSTILYSGVTDWGSSYAFVNFPYKSTNGTNGVARQISVGWTYESDPDLVVAKQMGYQGALTTFRDVFVKSTPNVDPSDPDLGLKASWGVKNESDGSVTVSTLGQRVVPEVLTAWKAASNVSTPNATSFSSAGYQPFEVQPTDRFYVISGQFDFDANSTGSVGFRVLASEDEYTDILYDPVAQNLTVAREHSSLVTAFDATTELAKLKLWRSVNSTTTTLNLTVIVDNSVVEVHANDEAIITTRVYPWLSNSTGAGLLAANVSGSAVNVTNLELWDGLINAWPERPANSSTGLVWDGPTAAIYGLWSGI